MVVKGLRGPSLKVGPDGLWRATRTGSGPATVRLRIEDRTLLAEAWGEGAGCALEQVPEWVGEQDDPEALIPTHPSVARAARLGQGMRMAAVGGLVEVLIPTILAQKVTGIEAARSYRELAARCGEPAPGPVGVGLRLPPDPDRLATSPTTTSIRSGWSGGGPKPFSGYAGTPAGSQASPGRTWPVCTGTCTGYRASGRGPAPRRSGWCGANPDAVPVGDFHLPNTITWALAGEPRGTDERMLELLAPYEGQRGRVARLLERYSGRAPAYGPRLAPRDIRRQ